MKHCERCGGTFDYEGYCKICGDDDDWTWNPPKYNKNKITCKKCGNEIYEVRRHCYYCGGKNEAAFKKGEYYCPCCGIAIEDEHCPNCGEKLEDLLGRKFEPIDLRYCTSCGKEISRNDEICLFCGRENYKISERIIWSEEAMHCPDCQKEIWVKDKFCPYCGRENIPKKPELREQTKNDEPVIHAKIPDTYKEKTYTQGYTYSDLNTTLWLVLGIITLIICCTPTSIGTIVCSLMAKSAENIGDYYTAKRKINAAKIWFFAGAAIVLSLMIASVVIQVTQNI